MKTRDESGSAEAGIPTAEEVLQTVLARIAGCRICIDTPMGRPLPHAPRPVVVASRKAKILIAGQAPGARVHASGRPFTDPSGDRLRDWLQVDSATFYDPERFAIVPMGFCFPGPDGKGGDLPPRRECAPAWRVELMRQMPQLQLVLAIGLYAQKWHLGALRQPSLTATVADWRRILQQSAGEGPAILPLPHPSWRNTAWIARNPWFTAELLPVLRAEIARLLAGD